MLIADDLQLDPVGEAHFAAEAGGANGFVGGVAAGGVGEDEHFFAVDVVEEGFFGFVGEIDAGAAAVMPLGAPIGSGMGIQNHANLRILRERITEVPMIVDAGVGTASDAAQAMELGADGLLMNTAIAEAQDATLMAEAMREATQAGRKAYLAGRMPKRLYAAASSPLAGIVR